MRSDGAKGATDAGVVFGAADVKLQRRGDLLVSHDAWTMLGGTSSTSQVT